MPFSYVDSKRNRFPLNVLDPDGLDEESIEVVQKSEERTLLVAQWIQQLMVDCHQTGVVAIRADSWPGFHGTFKRYEEVPRRAEGQGSYISHRL